MNNKRNTYGEIYRVLKKVKRCKFYCNSNCTDCNELDFLISVFYYMDIVKQYQMKQNRKVDKTCKTKQIVRNILLDFTYNEIVLLIRNRSI